MPVAGGLVSERASWQVACKYLQTGTRLSSWPNWARGGQEAGQSVCVAVIAICGRGGGGGAQRLLRLVFGGPSPWSERRAAGGGGDRRRAAAAVAAAVAAAAAANIFIALALLVAGRRWR